jgi:hypothetical protein
MCDIQEKILYQFFCTFLGVLRMQTIISSRFNIKLVAHKAKNKRIAGNSRVLTSRCSFLSGNGIICKSPQKHQHRISLGAR